MSDWFERFVPAYEREKIKAKMSPEEYEKFRERVRARGPEYLRREMKMNSALADLKLNIELEPKMSDELKGKVKDDLLKFGAQEVLEKPVEVGEDFELDIEDDPETHEDRLVVVLPGKVREKIPIKPAFSEKYLSQSA